MNDSTTSTQPTHWSAVLAPWTTPLTPQVLLRTFSPQARRSQRVSASELIVEAPAPQLPDTDTETDTGTGTGTDNDPTSTTHSVAWGVGQSVEVEADQTILEALEANDIEPTVGCRRGVCRRCVVPLNAGCVRDHRDERDIQAGTHVRICVASPLTDIELDPSEAEPQTAKSKSLTTTGANR